MGQASDRDVVRRQQKVAEAQQNLLAAEAAQAEVQQLVQQTAQELAEVQATYQQNQRPERPNSRLAKVRQQAEVYQQRLERRRQAVLKVQAWLGQQQTRLAEWADQKALLSIRWQRFQAENTCNPNPIQAVLRLDAGFGDAGNLALLIEMGYEVYSKPYGTWLSGTLAKMSKVRTQDWQKVGQNAEMLAWKAVHLEDFPYPLDLGYESFWQSPAASPPQLAYSGLLHFGQKDVCADLPAWFHRYNARQTIEAGNKEIQQIFEVHHIKVRSRPAMRLQEHFALFAANFVRFAADWLAEQCPQVPAGWRVSQSPKVKEQVKVGAHSPARVEWNGSDCLLLIFELRKSQNHAEKATNYPCFWHFPLRK